MRAASRRPWRWRPLRFKHLKFRKPASGIYHDAGVQFWRLWRIDQREYACSVPCPFSFDISCHYVSLCRSLIFLPPPSFLFPSTWDPGVFIIIIIIFPFWWLSYNKHSISLWQRSYYCHSEVAQHGTTLTLLATSWVRRIVFAQKLAPSVAPGRERRLHTHTGQLDHDELIMPWKVFDNLQLFDLTKSIFILNYITFAVFHFECLIFCTSPTC